MISHLRIGTKMILLIGLSALAMVAIAATDAMTLHQRMLDDRTDKLLAVVDSGIAIATGLQARVGSKELTRQQALDLFHGDIRAIRFDDGTGYLAVTDTQTGNLATVAAAAEQAGTGLHSVASASEELTASIGEISRQVGLVLKSAFSLSKQADQLASEARAFVAGVRAA